MQKTVVVAFIFFELFLFTVTGSDITKYITKIYIGTAAKLCARWCRNLCIVNDKLNNALVTSVFILPAGNAPRI